MGLVLLTGGARSGKSRLATELAARHDGPVVVLVTAEALDEEMAEPIRLHRDARSVAGTTGEARSVEWTTVEEPLDLERAIAATPAQAFLVVDCLSLWVANLMGREVPSE